jgi:hypothetical protein
MNGGICPGCPDAVRFACFSLRACFTVWAGCGEVGPAEIVPTEPPVVYPTEAVVGTDGQAAVLAA